MKPEQSCMRVVIAFLSALTHPVSADDGCTIDKNRLSSQYAIATSVFGGVSMVICMGVIAVILAYKKEKSSLRERIIFGLMMVNIMYSIANLLPSQYYKDDCNLLFSTEQDIWIRGVWIWAKYSMVCWQITYLHWNIENRQFLVPFLLYRISVTLWLGEYVLLESVSYTLLAP